MYARVKVNYDKYLEINLYEYSPEELGIILGALSSSTVLARNYVEEFPLMYEVDVCGRDVVISKGSIAEQKKGAVE